MVNFHRKVRTDDARNQHEAGVFSQLPRHLPRERLTGTDLLGGIASQGRRRAATLGGTSDHARTEAATSAKFGQLTCFGTFSPENPPTAQPEPPTSVFCA